jgi:hypothetical protein
MAFSLVVVVLAEVVEEVALLVVELVVVPEVPEGLGVRWFVLEGLRVVLELDSVAAVVALPSRYFLIVLLVAADSVPPSAPIVLRLSLMKSTLGAPVG